MAEITDDAIRDAAVEQKIADFKTIMGKLLDALYFEADPFFVLTDADGDVWPQSPAVMNDDDILRYIDARFGEPYTGFARRRLPNLSRQ